MGIKGLTKLLADNASSCMKEQKFKSYFGRKIAVDASMSIYQFFIVVGRTGTEMLTNQAGEVTRLCLIERFVFSNLELSLSMFLMESPPELKRQELAKRNYFTSVRASFRNYFMLIVRKQGGH